MRAATDMPGTTEKPFWWGLGQDVWEQHLSCTSEQEVVTKAIALVDDRVGGLLARRRHDPRFGRVTGALLTVAATEFPGDCRDLCFPIDFDQSRYVRPGWRLSGVWAAHERLHRWADLAARFRDWPPRLPAAVAH